QDSWIKEPHKPPRRNQENRWARGAMLCQPLHDKIAPSQPCPPAKARVASPYRVGRQHGECPSRTPRPVQAVGRACLRGPAWFQRHTVCTIARESPPTALRKTQGAGQADWRVDIAGKRKSTLQWPTYHQGGFVDADPRENQ